MNLVEILILSLLFVSRIDHISGSQSICLAMKMSKASD